MSPVADLCPDCCDRVLEPFATEPAPLPSYAGPGHQSVLCSYICHCGNSWTTSWVVPIEELAP